MAKTVTISVTLTQAELKLAEKLAKEHGLPLAQCVKQFRLCDQVFEEHFETLKRRAAAQPEGQPFTVMGLFDDAEWNDLDRGLKLSLGRTFNHFVRGGKLPGVRPAGKNSSNVQLYEKERPQTALEERLAALAAEYGLEKAEPGPLTEELVERGEAAELAQLLEEAKLAGSSTEQALARQYEAALDEALRFDPLENSRDEAFCNCGEEAQGEAFDGWDR